MKYAATPRVLRSNTSSMKLIGGVSGAELDVMCTAE
jgi:hypothetical protein